MSQLIARIGLAILMFPAAAVLYLVTYFFGYDMFGGSRDQSFLLAGAFTWLFVIAYWGIVWVRVIRWNWTRFALTFLTAPLLAVLMGFAASVFMGELRHDVANLVGTMVAPILWLIFTTIAWRETATERSERLRSLNKTAVACPKCGYNLTGLQGTRCPECGTLYTIDELLAEQPSRADRDMND